MLMKITKVKKNYDKMGRPNPIDLSTVVDDMRNGKVNAGKWHDTERLPWLIFSATFGQKGFNNLRERTGLLLMEADCGWDMQRMNDWRRQVAQMPYTVLAFQGADWTTLEVVVRIAPANGGDVTSDEAYMHLLQEAQRQVQAVYQTSASVPLQGCELTWKSGCRMNDDARLYFNDTAQAFPVVMKDGNPLAAYQDTRMEQDGSVAWYPTETERERLRMEFYTCMQQAVEECGNGDDEQVLNCLANKCRRARLEEEACVKRTLWQGRFSMSEDLVRKVFRAVYARQYRGKTVSPMNQKERIAHSIRDFFSRRYQLRYNVVKQVTEFRPNDQTFKPWQPLSDRDLRRIAFEEMLEGGQGWMIDIELFVNSSLVRRYNPIHEFLAGVGEWDGKHDYIEDYARRLKTDYDRWPHFFHRWLLAMVAQALEKNRDHGNSMVPMLIGTQAMKKSTFCKNILPYSLREYYMDDIKMDNAEQVERVLGRMWLVNIDEYNAKTEREQAKIKRLLTEKDVQIRKMRSDQYTLTPRLCSFIATTNDRQPLCDPTGSRRYLCVEMTGQADMSGRINYQQMYAQAVWEIDHGAQYWFDNDDEREITVHNAKYQMMTSIEEVLRTLFMPAPHESTNFLTTTAIQQQLRQSLSASDVPTLGVLGRTLKRMHYPQGSQNGIHGYYLSSRE